jgi:hypothetical protein
VDDLRLPAVGALLRGRGAVAGAQVHEAAAVRLDREDDLGAVLRHAEEFAHAAAVPDGPGAIGEDPPQVPLSRHR